MYFRRKKQKRGMQIISENPLNPLNPKGHINSIKSFSIPLKSLPAHYHFAFAFNQLIDISMNEK